MLPTERRGWARDAKFFEGDWRTRFAISVFGVLFAQAMGDKEGRITLSTFMPGWPEFEDQTSSEFDELTRMQALKNTLEELDFA